MTKKIKLIIVIVFMLLLLASCQGDDIIITDRTFALDTLIEIKIYGKENTINQSIIDDAFTLIRDLEDTLSVHIAKSDLYNLKENAGATPVTVSPITYSIISDSTSYSLLTDGLFDVTAGPLIDLWAIDPPNGHVPTAEELDTALDLIDYTKIDFQEDNRIYIDKDMIINLGAIAKGSIADEVKTQLMASGVKSSLINLGGNVLLLGSKPDGSDFSIGIQNPFDLRGSYPMTVALSDVAVVSSGDYERFFVFEGQEYHHILDTHTGYPAQTNIKQVSIIAPTSQMADALSTSVLLLGLKDGLALIDSLDGVEAIFITKDKKIYITNALRDKITQSQEQMKDFTIVDSLANLFN